MIYKIYRDCNILHTSGNANANKYHRNANTWSADYTRLHLGQHAGLFTGSSHARKVSVARISLDALYKGLSLVFSERKGPVVKQGIKKGINAVVNLSPGLLLASYCKYFNRINLNSRGRVSPVFVEHYQRYYKNNLRKVVISESSRVLSNTAMTECHHIYFPSGSGMLNKISAVGVMATNGGALASPLISGNYHKNIAQQIHNKNPMEKKNQRLRHL